MRIASIPTADGLRPGVVAGDELVDLDAADPALGARWAALLD